MIALTRAVSPALGRCELTHLERRPIDLDRAREQHRAYERTLAELGCEVRRLPAEPEMPDSVFVEDIAVVLDEVAILARPGAAARRQETPSVAAALEPFRPVARIRAPGTLDGGDVLPIGRTLFVGRSSRTNAEGERQLAAAVSGRGYSVRGVAIEACLHLKSAATAVADDMLLINPAWVEASSFQGLRILEVDPAEPAAANALRVGARVVLQAEHRRTLERLRRAGVDASALDASELAKAEGGLTCCSLIFDEGAGA